MKPTKKSPDIDNFLIKTFGVDRKASISSNTCIAPPYGCGKAVTPNSFRDEISLKEYRISGLCQECRDKIFG